MKYIDTHSHLNFQKFEADKNEVIGRSLEEDVGMIIVGTDLKTSKKAVELANLYEDGVWAAVGLHPIHLEDQIGEDENGRAVVRGRAEEYIDESYEKLAGLEKVVAIGEIGLDYYHLKLSSDLTAKKNKQKEVLKKQLLLARSLDLPAIIHCRNAHNDLYDLLNDFRHEHNDLIPKEKAWGVIHCFSGDENLAWDYFNLGLMVSFTGIITFSSAWDELIRKVPLEKIMIETDCPFMAPEPYRGQKNEPSLVKLVAERIAKIRQMDPDKVALATTQNAKKFFNI
ncbi:YchF/TatD family DNA exonuclease [Candidatus Falkowbacteria bacterium]|nr:YchF/TatD family DNA exonuclease [Candidatus Falkowbacteria bacterium]